MFHETCFLSAFSANRSFALPIFILLRTIVRSEMMVSGWPSCWFHVVGFANLIARSRETKETGGLRSWLGLLRGSWRLGDEVLSRGFVNFYPAFVGFGTMFPEFRKTSEGD